jgi:hypothetical protein
VAELNENFGYFDFFMIQFPNKEHGRLSRQFMGIVDTNPPCIVLCNETEVESNFGASIERLEWLNETLLKIAEDGTAHEALTLLG